jgi:hypothetical protein
MLWSNKSDVDPGFGVKDGGECVKSWQVLSAKQIITSRQNSLNTKNPSHMTLEILVLAQGRHRNMAELNWADKTQKSCYGQINQM